MDEIGVLIIDEHSAVCQALALRLNAVASIQVVGATCDFAEGKRVAQFTRPDVILLELKTSGRCDDHGPYMDPVLAISELLGVASGRIIILTSYRDELECNIAIGAGAKRYLLKDIDTARLVTEIKEVAREDLLSRRSRQ